MRPLARRLGALLLAVALVLLGTAYSPAEAHAYLTSSNPADGSRLEKAPPTLELSFSEHVVASATHLTVVDTSGHVIPVTGVHLVSSDPNDTEEPAKVVATWGHALPSAAYRVSWETLSSDDLHRTSGVFVFGIGRTVHTTAAAEPRPSVDESSLRGGLLIGLALVLGGLLAGRVSLRVGADGATSRRLAGWGAVTALAMSVLLLVSQLVQAGSGLSSVLLSAYGARWLFRCLGLVLLALAVRRAPSPPRTVAVWVGVVVTCLGTALLGHAAAGRLSPTRVLADAAHLGATLSWGGAVICLALTLLVARRTGDAVGVRLVLRAFAVPAAACLSVAVVTGIYLTSAVVGSVDAALLTVYGRTLLLKLAVVGAAVGLGLVNHLRLRHGSDVRLPRLTVPAEACAVVGVVLLTAVLTSSQPATEPQYVRPLPADSAPAVGRLADLQVSAGIRPNRPGRAVAVIDVFDTRRPAPAPVTGVTVSVAGLDPVEAQPIGDGHWSTAVTVSRSGAASLRVRVRRAGEPVVSRSFPWRVGSGLTPRPAALSQAPLRRPLVGTSAAVAAALAALWGAGLLRRRVRRARPSRLPETVQPTGVGATV